MNCSGNGLTALDLTGCAGLSWVNCSGNLLEALTLPAGDTLCVLDCSNNRLSSLDLSVCTGLNNLDCSGNSLTALDVSACEDLNDCVVNGTMQKDVSTVGIPRVRFSNDKGCQLLVDERVAKNVLIPAPFPPADFTLAQSYLILGRSTPITASSAGEIHVVGLDPRWADELKWAVTADGSVPEVDPEYDGHQVGEVPVRISESSGEGCLASAVDVGTAYVVAYIRGDGGTVLSSASCRVDVTENGGVEITGVYFSQTKVDVELYKAEYPRLTVIPELPQNLAADAVDAVIVEPEQGEDNGVIIKSARFTDDTLDGLFGVRVVDDRTLEIVPTMEAISAPDTVMSSYSSPIKLVFDYYVRNPDDPYSDEPLSFTTEVTAPAVKLTVKKSLPKLSAKAVKLNSFLPGATQAIGFNCAVAAVALDGDKDNPDWLYLDPIAQSVSYTGAAEVKKSGKLFLLAQPEGWNVMMPVTVSVSAANSAPKLSVKPGTLSVNPATLKNAGYAVGTVTVTPANYGGEFGLPVEAISVKEGSKELPMRGPDAPLTIGYDSSGATVYASLGPDAPTDGKAHTYKVTLALMRGDQPSSVRTTLTVKLLASGKISMSASAAGAMDAAVLDSSVTVNVKIKGVANPRLGFEGGIPSYPVPATCHITILKEKSGKSEDVTDGFAVTKVSEDGLCFTVREDIPGTLESGYTYTAVIEQEFGVTTESCRVRLPVKFSKVSKARPSATLKVTGAIDVIRPGSTVTVTPVLKNCSTYAPYGADLKVWRVQGKTVTDATADFSVSVKDGSFLVRLKPEADHGLYKYRVSLSANVLALNEELAIVSLPLESAQAAMNVKQGAAKLTQSAKSVTLAQYDINSRGLLTISAEDDTLADIDWVKTAAAFSAPGNKQPFFKLIPLGKNSCAIGYAGENFPSAKSGTVKLPVYLKGNGSGKPNATLSVKVELLDNTPNMSFPDP